MSKHTILILGKGYVGTQLNEYLQSSKDINIFHRSRAELDYQHRGTLQAFININNITHIVNCSGFTGRPNVDECELKKWECWNLNTVVPYNVNVVCERTGVEYISSGCIFSGYDKAWEETDPPNFGVDSECSFYSRSKHAYEEISKKCCIVRVRMPFCGDFTGRSYLTKIKNYNDLVDYKNSKTYIPDLCRFVKTVIMSDYTAAEVGIINVVNPEPLHTKDVAEIMSRNGMRNPLWNWVPIEDLKITAPRSNCTLSINKLENMFPDFKIQSESSAMEQAFINYSK